MVALLDTTEAWLSRLVEPTGAPPVGFRLFRTRSLGPADYCVSSRFSFLSQGPLERTGVQARNRRLVARRASLRTRWENG